MMSKSAGIVTCFLKKEFLFRRMESRLNRIKVTVKMPRLFKNSIPKLPSE
jgi:hypothetical protein